PVGSAVGQSLVLGAEYTVIVFVIHIFPPFVAAFLGLRPLVGGGQHTSVFKYLFADMRSFVGGIGNNRLYFREVRCHTVIHFIKRHAVMYISRGNDCLQDKAMFVAGCMGLIGKLPLVVSFH